jgi:hypothetical protein
MDQVPLTGLVTDLLSGDRCRQRAAVDSFVDEDVRFSHILGTLRGREAFYGIYRLAATVWRYKVSARARVPPPAAAVPCRCLLPAAVRSGALLRNAHTILQITWVEYIRSGNTVVLQLDLGIKVPPFYLVR